MPKKRAGFKKPFEIETIPFEGKKCEVCHAEKEKREMIPPIVNCSCGKKPEM